MTKKKWVITLMWAIGVLLFTACTNSEQKDRKPSADWSRSLVLGQHIAGSPGLLIDSQREHIHTVWAQALDDQYSLQYVRLNQKGEWVQIAQREVTGIIKAPRLLPAGDGQYHLIWAGRTPGDKTWDLWHLLLDEKADLEAEPSHLSAADVNIGKYALVADGQGGVIMTWDNGQVSDISLERVDANGRITHPAQTVTQAGRSPDLKVDAHGLIHLIWYHEKHIYYIHGELGTLAATTPIAVADLRQGGTLESTGDTLQGPVIGLSNGWTYVFWSVLNNSDTDAVRGASGIGQTDFVAFPVTQPQLSAIKPVNVLTLEHPPWFDYEGHFSLSQIGPALDLSQAAREYGQAESFLSSDHGDWIEIDSVSQFMLNPATMSGQGEELAVALAVSQDYGLDKHLQIATAVFADGQYQGYSIASKTQGLSDQPTIAIDDGGNIHLVWREGAKGTDLYYATTAPVTKAALDRFSLSDITNIGLNVLLQTVASMALLPLLSMWWILGGLAVLVLATTIKKVENGWGFWLAIFVAFAAYNLIKYLFLPSLITYVPFSAWIYISQKMALPLRLGMPLFILGFGGWAAYRIQQRHVGSLIRPYISLTLTDALLTLAIYGVTLQGAL